MQHAVQGVHVVQGVHLPAEVLHVNFRGSCLHSPRLRHRW